MQGLLPEGEGRVLEEAKVLCLATFAGRMRVFREEHKNTLEYLHNMEYLLDGMQDYEGALDYYQ